MRTQSAAVGATREVRIVRIADEDADARSLQRFEGVLVGDVIAHVQRHDLLSVEIEGLEQVQHGLAERLDPGRFESERSR